MGETKCRRPRAFILRSVVLLTGDSRTPVNRMLNSSPGTAFVLCIAFLYFEFGSDGQLPVGHNGNLRIIPLSRREQGDAGTGFISRTSVGPSKYHSTITPYSYFTYYRHHIKLKT